MCTRFYHFVWHIPAAIWVRPSQSVNYTGWPPKKRNSRYSRVSGLCSDQQFSFFTLLDRASFPHYNNTKIIKFGWELLILWVFSYGLSFSGFARLPEFRGTINDSFSSTCANTYQHSTSYKEISVPMTCLHGLYMKIIVKQYTDHWTQYSLSLCTAEAVINRASELWKSGKSRKSQSIRNYS